MSQGDKKPTISELVSSIEAEFKGISKPVAAEDIARLYGVIGAQTETMIAVYALMMKANPNLIFSEERIRVEQALRAQTSTWADALTSLAEHYGKTEGGDV